MPCLLAPRLWHQLLWTPQDLCCFPLAVKIISRVQACQKRHSVILSTLTWKYSTTDCSSTAAVLTWVVRFFNFFHYSCYWFVHIICAVFYGSVVILLLILLSYCKLYCSSMTNLPYLVDLCSICLTSFSRFPKLWLLQLCSSSTEHFNWLQRSTVERYSKHKLQLC